MKTDEVPQDSNQIFRGERKAVYAVDANGQYTTVASSGWEVEQTVTLAAVEIYDDLARQTRARVESGQASTLEFHMHHKRMDLAMLAASTGICRMRVRRHLTPRGFARLSQNRLQRYADALGLDIESLRRLPEADEDKPKSPA